jgi:TolA-binding protein
MRRRFLVRRLRWRFVFRLRGVFGWLWFVLWWLRGRLSEVGFDCIEQQRRQLEMRFRSFVSVFIVVLLICFAATLYAQDAPQPDPAVDAQVSSAFAQAAAADKAAYVDQAAQIYWSIVDRFPDHPLAPTAAKQAAYATDKLKDRDKSIAAFKRAVDTYPNSEFAPVLKRSLALSYQAKGDKVSAINELKDLVARFPKSDPASEGLVNLGLLYVSQVSKDRSDAENWTLKDDADAALKQVVDTFPAKRDVCARAELMRAGIAFERAWANRMSWDDAIKQVQGVKDAYPDAPKDALARLDLMQAEKKRNDGDNASAAKLMDAIVANYPMCKQEIGWANYIAGHAYEDMGNYTTALERYQAVVKGDYSAKDNFKDRDVALYCLLQSAECYVQLKRIDDAKAIWESILIKYPNAPKAQIAVDRLKEIGGGG